MTEETTTDEFGQGIGAEASGTQEQPEESAEITAAEQETNAGDEPEIEDAEQAEPEIDEDVEYIKTQKNIDPSDPDAFKKMAKMYRNAEKAMHEQRQANAPRIETELQNTQTAPQTQMDIIARDMQMMKNRQMSADFKAKVNLTPEEETKMAEFLQQPTMLPNGQQIRRGELVVNGLMSLEDVYKLIGGGAVDPKTIQEQTRKQTLAEISSKQRAQRLAGGSTDSKQFGSGDKEDDFLDGFNQA